MSHAWKFGKVGKYIPLTGRILIGLIFIFNGLIKLMELAGTAAYVESYGVPYATAMVIIAATVELVAGTMIIVGFHARIAAVVLALYTVVVTVVLHSNVLFPLQLTMATKNLAILGGLLYVMKYGGGPLSMRNARCGCCKDHACAQCGTPGACENCGSGMRRVPPPMGA